MCLLDGPDDGADGRDEREDSGGVLPALVLAVLLAVFRFDIDDVVLLQVEAGRLEQLLAAQVVLVHHPLPVLLTDDRHTVHPAPLGDIARLGDGLQQGDAVALHREGAGVAHRAQDGILEIEELQRHQRVLDILPVDDAVAYQGGHLAHLQPLHMQLAQDGETNVPFHVHTVAFLHGSGLRHRAVGTHREGPAARVERDGQLGVLVEGKFAYLLPAPKREQPSRRNVAWSK